ncbi:MAG: glutaredoxin-like protein NrdH [Aerococcus sp.]|nr:glutaredoxin-like protein NrdH [Aerococcus sp.]
MVKVYAKPGCMQCNFTKKFLADNNIEFEVSDVTESEDALNEVKAMGFQAVPVVVADDIEPFFGFRPDLLKKLA